MLCRRPPAPRPSLFPMSICIAPTVSMLLGSGAVFLVDGIPPSVQAIFQNVSAGILFAAIAGELFPMLSAEGAAGLPGSISITLGAGAAMLLFFGLSVRLAHMSCLHAPFGCAP
eukprot:SAG25_NODE_206_length_11883_cov_5.639511_14_plen_114_part_00